MREALRLHSPILLALLLSWLSFGLICGIHAWAGYPVHFIPATPVEVLVFIAGLVYVGCFEWLWHWGPDHHDIPGLRSVRRDHEHNHHGTFYRDTFRSRDWRRARKIVTNLLVFQALNPPHYVAGRLLLGRYVLVFMFGVLIGFDRFEVSHWLTHVPGTLLERIILGTPGVRCLWLVQLQHHEAHHNERAIVVEKKDGSKKKMNFPWNFSFTWPFWGDWLFSTKKK